jgi:hypothetical protein
MNLLVQSRSITNITQIFVFSAVFVCIFQMLLHYVRRYSKFAEKIPPHLHASTVIRYVLS